MEVANSLTVTGESTRCTFDSSTRISRAFAHNDLTSASVISSQFRSFSIWQSKSDFAKTPMLSVGIACLFSRLQPTLLLKSRFFWAADISDSEMNTNSQKGKRYSAVIKGAKIQTSKLRSHRLIVQIAKIQNRFHSQAGTELWSTGCLAIREFCQFTQSLAPVPTKTLESTITRLNR